MIGWEKRVLLRHYLEQGMTKAAVAKLLGVSRRTVHYWIETEQLDGFYPARADTSEKAHLGPGGVSWQSEGSTARSLNVRRSG